jgi:hydroxymethylglutaryl-CoA lyase
MAKLRGSIFEVGLRDGLQSEARHFSIEEKTYILEKLIASDLGDIEVGSFVRADKIPQLENSSIILKKAQEIRTSLKTKTRFWVFIPNLKGFQLAETFKPDGMSFFYSTSPTFCLKNVNREQTQLLSELKELLPLAKKNKFLVRVYLSTLVYCPYEKEIKAERVLKAVKELVDIGVTEIALSDTTGHANPTQIRKILQLLKKKYSINKFSLHLHDTRGLALANVWEAMQWGVTRFDSSVGGLGGCPYAPGASGNLSTEDLWNLLNGMSALPKPLKIEKILEAGFFVENCLARPSTSKVLRSYSSAREKSK